jgi:hypothetical protein
MLFILSRNIYRMPPSSSFLYHDFVHMKEIVISRGVFIYRMGHVYDYRTGQMACNRLTTKDAWSDNKYIHIVTDLIFMYFVIGFMHDV